MDLEFMYGLCHHMSIWSYVVVGFLMVQVTMMAVTLYLHRDAAHRGVDLHPVLRHFFRFWIWATSGMITAEWVAVHRKHHAFSDVDGDPHSPVMMGLRKILLQGAEVYRDSARDPEIVAKYGRGTPDDWLERNVYARHRNLGIVMLVLADLVIFGVPGIVLIAVQLVSMPLMAAGVINGLGHAVGYRNFECDNAARNLMPWGLITGGEELHNNHHAYASSARLSSKWWELDIGWVYIRLLTFVRLAQVKRVAPRIKLERKSQCDAETLQAVIAHRYDVLARYAISVKRTCAEEIQNLKARAVLADRGLIKRWLQSDEQQLTAPELERMREMQRHSSVLDTVCSMRRDLVAVWARSTATKEQLVRQLEDWCHRAEASGIVALRDFSKRLRCYALRAT